MASPANITVAPAVQLSDAQTLVLQKAESARAAANGKAYRWGAMTPTASTAPVSWYRFSMRPMDRIRWRT